MQLLVSNNFQKFALPQHFFSDPHVFEPPDNKHPSDFTLSFPWNVQIEFLNQPNRLS